MKSEISLLLKWNDFLNYPARYAEPSHIQFLYPDIRDKQLDAFLRTKSGTEVLSRRLLRDLRLDGGQFDPDGLDRPGARLALLDRETIWQIGLTAALLSYAQVLKTFVLKRQLAPILKAVGPHNYRLAAGMVADGLDADVPQRHGFDLEAWRTHAGDLISLWMQTLTEPVRRRVALKFPRAFGPAMVVRTPQAMVGFQTVCDAKVDQCLATIH